MLIIDGSHGEGGGQILRTSLSLALVTGREFRIERIRAGRAKPGLQRQHLTAVNAAATIGQAVIAGASLGSQELSFRPREIVPGTHYFSIGTAGSAVLVLQTILPALLNAASPSTLTIEGGTHNPTAPPFDFLDKAFLPILRRLGFQVTAELERYGFYPAGGGKITVHIEPPGQLHRIELLDRGEIRAQRATVLISRLPRHIAERELSVLGRELGWDEKHLKIKEVTNSRGPGNAVLVEIAGQEVTEIFAGFGQRGVKAEAVADGVVREVRRYLKSDAPVGEHLADQLIIPLALAQGGAFRTLPLTPHTTTNIGVVQKFLNIEITITESKSAHHVQVETRDRA